MTVSVRQARLSGLFSSSRWQILVESMKDLIFPPVCGHCGRVDEKFCLPCLNALENAAVELHLEKISPTFLIASSGLHADILQNAVISLKYDRGFAVAPLLAARICTMLAQLNWTIDIVAPVPLHTSRLQERGYNQAKEISSKVAEQLTLPHQPEALERIRNTRSQVELNRTERLLNMGDAFIAQANMVSGKTLLLIDDVFTTGATLSACAAAALAAGASNVYGMTITSAQV